MKEILVSKNRSCFCNSNKKFKECCGVNISNEAIDTYKIYFLLKDVYSKSFAYFSKNYDVNTYVEDFKIFNNIPKENETKFEQSFKFIEFLLFNAIEKSSKKSLAKNLINNPLLDKKEKQFLEELLESNIFSIFKVLQYDEDIGFLKIKNIFTDNEYDIHNKVFKNLEKDGLIYGRIYTIYSRVGLLPTISFKKAKEIKSADLEKSIASHKKRFEHEKESHKELTLEKFINSIEYEVYGGDNPYVEYELDERFEEFKKKNPKKDFDDFLDEIEEEMLELK